MFTEDLSPLFADLGVPVVFGEYETMALLDVEESTTSLAQGLGMMAQHPTITFASTALPNLAHNDILIVNDTTYTVGEVTALDDGAITRATLKRKSRDAQ